MPLQYDLIDINLYCYFLINIYHISDEVVKNVVLYYLNKYYDDNTNDVDYTRVTEEIEKSIKTLTMENKIPPLAS